MSKVKKDKWYSPDEFVIIFHKAKVKKKDKQHMYSPDEFVIIFHKAKVKRKRINSTPQMNL
jgi:hypothetical protein